MTPLEAALLDVMEPLANLDEMSWQDARIFQMAGELLGTWRGDEKPTPDQVMAARKRSGFTQAKLARMFHVNAYSVRRWEIGAYRQDGQDRPLAVPHWVIWFYRLRRNA
jgi:DNA-binding transcriptional regulator YiaG